MAQQCFRKPGSNPPVCGIDGAYLQETSYRNPGARHFVCPTSGSRIKEIINQSSSRPSLADLLRTQESQRERLWHLRNEFQGATAEQKAEFRKLIAAVVQDIERLDGVILAYKHF